MYDSELDGRIKTQNNFSMEEQGQFQQGGISWVI
jgi:hypothetical protein